MKHYIFNWSRNQIFHTNGNVTTNNCRDICRPYLTQPEHRGEVLQVIRILPNQEKVYLTFSSDYKDHKLQGKLQMIDLKESDIEPGSKLGRARIGKIQPADVISASANIPAASEQEKSTANKPEKQKESSVGKSNKTTGIWEKVIAVEEKYQKYFKEVYSDDAEVQKVNGRIEELPEEHPLFKSFFFSKDDVEKIDTFNKYISDETYIIQKYALFEGFIGNLEKAEILLFSNNPGSNGHWLDQSDEAIKKDVKNLKLFQSHWERLGTSALSAQEAFYPCDCFWENEKCWLPYFPSRLICGLGEADGNEKILDPIRDGRDCRDVLKANADKIATFERFGYHSQYFKNHENELLKTFDAETAALQTLVKDHIRKAMDQKKIIIFLRGLSKNNDGWNKFLGNEIIKQLEEYDFAFFTTQYNLGLISKGELLPVSDFISYKQKPLNFQKEKEETWKKLVEKISSLKKAGRLQ